MRERTARRTRIRIRIRSKAGLKTARSTWRMTTRKTVSIWRNMNASMVLMIKTSLRMKKMMKSMPMMRNSTKVLDQK